jgi:formylglycine-generating enzyme required for sulfatase activity
LAKGDFAFKVMTAKPRRGRLHVDTQPREAGIRILNIGPKFSQGISLEPGRYHLEVSADGYRMHKQWVTLAAGEEKTISVRLSQIKMQFDNSLGMRFRFIPAGSFEMGSRAAPPGAAQDETVHRVTLSQPFYMQTGEVTVDQYRRFEVASGYESKVQTSGGCWTSVDGRRWRKQAGIGWETIASNWPWGVGAEAVPVSCIAWQDARAFARWLSKKDGRSYRLPTEAQWEYACRSGSTTAFAFGECLSSEQANFVGGDPSTTHCPSDDKPPRRHLVPTDSLASNAWGLFHMHGNVAEWCRDFYGPYPKTAVRDPLGSANGTERVIRGGHFLSRMSDCRSAKRSSFPPQYASSAVGFRLTAPAE